MKPGENLNNLSQAPCGSQLDSTTENNSESTDSDMEVLGSADGDQNCTIQASKITIRRYQNKLKDLSAKLTISENNLAREKEKTSDKEDVIKSLKLSLDLFKANGQGLKIVDCVQHKTKIDELNAYIEILECKLKNRNGKICELDDITEKYEISLKDKNEHIAELESQLKLSLNTIQKCERSLEEKDESIAELESQAKADTAKIKKLEDKLSTFTFEVASTDANSASFVFLNCTKIPSVQFVKLPRSDNSIAAVFEDLPSAGPGWMLIQRRIDGSVNFRTNVVSYRVKFGDLGREFWIGCELLHLITASRRHELYIELVDFDNATAYARYNDFVVGNSAEGYALKSLGEYSGNAGSELWINGKFLFDKCNDSCAGWWNGVNCNLNGHYYDCKTILNSTDGIWWGTWNMGQRHSLKSCKMLIRPRP